MKQLVHLAGEIVGVVGGGERQQGDVELQQTQHFIGHFASETVGRGVLRDSAKQRAETAEIDGDREVCE